MGVIKRFVDFLGFGEEELDDRDEAVASETEQTPEPRRSRGNVVSIHAQKTSKVVLAQPETYRDVVDLIEHLRARRVLLINLQGMEPEVSTRIVDKLQGAVLAFNGRLETVGVGIYMCAPDNFEINGGIDLKKQFSGGDFEQPETEANH